MHTGSGCLARPACAVARPAVPAGWQSGMKPETKIAPWFKLSGNYTGIHQITQNLRSHYAELTQPLRRFYAAITHIYAELRRFYADFTQSLRRFYADLRSHYADFTQSLRSHYAMITQPLRSHYAIITQCLRNVYAKITQSLRKVYANQLRSITQFITQLFYAIVLRNCFTQLFYAFLRMSVKEKFTQKSCNLRNGQLADGESSRPVLKVYNRLQFKRSRELMAHFP